MYLYLFAIAFLVIFSSCENQSCNAAQFFGISANDINGQPFTSPDPDDWNFDDHWDKGVQALFDSDHDDNCTPSFDHWIAGYPNPASGQFAVSFGKDSSTVVEMRLVDFVCGTQFSLDGFTGFNIHIQPENYQPGSILRLYYKFIEDGCEYQGHGDILMLQ